MYSLKVKGKEMKKKVIILLTLIMALCFCFSITVACDDTNGGEQTYSEGLHFQKISGKQEYRLIGLGTASDINIVIPKEYKGLPVTEIGEGALSGDQNKGCLNIEQVVMPNSITVVGARAFKGCKALKNVTISEYVTEIFAETFSQCTALTTVTFSTRLASIGQEAFYNCDSLTSASLPQSLSIIGDRAFSSCEKLATVNIGKNVQSIGIDAFFYCSSLSSFNVATENQYFKSIDGSLYSGDARVLIQYAIGKADALFTVPEGVLLIGEKAFYHADNLYFLTLPQSLVNVSDGAFSYCAKLETMLIRNNVISFGGGVFSSSNNLLEIYFEGEPGEWYAISYGHSWESAMQRISVYFYSNQPQQYGNYWRYVDNFPTKWN